MEFEDLSKYHLTYNDKKYAIDLNVLKKVCLLSDVGGKKKDSEITESYEINDSGDMELTTKIIRDVDSERNTQGDMILYDVVKLFILKLLENEHDGFSTSIALNTLIMCGILIEIK